jgi:excisionase family DNA binding protein
LNFETADKAAARLGVTIRAVQKWAKEGKIPFAHKVGRDWMIPNTAVRPSDKATISFKTPIENQSETENKRSLFSAFPLMKNFFFGKIEDFISALETEEERKMGLCEYYYMIGELSKCAAETEPLLNSPDSEIRVTAAVYCVFSNLAEGHLNKSRYASKIIQKSLEESFSENKDEALAALTVFSALSVKLMLQLPIDSIPPIKDYVRFLDDGLKAVGCYLLAYGEYLEKKYEKALGVAETALSLCKENYILPKIYLHIISAMACINLMEMDEAKKHIDEAYNLASPYGIIMPFVEHYTLLGGLIENAFKTEHIDYYNRILSYSKQYNSSWFEVYNNSSEKTVADNLTNSEFTIAMLYSRNWRVKEIASHMGLSQRTVANYISYVYDKLQISSKKELEKYMLR